MTQTQINTVVRNFKSWDITNPQITLWSFRKRKVDGQVSYTAKWISTDDSISSTLVDLFAVYQNSFEEAIPYATLAEVSDNQFLYIANDSTHIDLLIDLTDRIKENHQASQVKDLDNSTGYILKIEANGQIAFAIKKTDESWKSRKAGGFINAFFQDSELTLLDDRAFKLAKKFDLIVFNEGILIENKRNFESLLDYNVDFQNSFSEMTENPSFSKLFSSVDNIKTFVGTNTLHLRRMHVINQKNLYSDRGFILRLIEKNRSERWGVIIDDDGIITPTPETVKTIITLLLDHRLKSELSLGTFDVPSSISITV